MTLIKTSLLNAIAVAIRLATLFGINKILAIYVGPTGYVLLGQFQNAIQIIIGLTSGAINTSVTKYTSEYSDDLDNQKRLWGTSGTISISVSIIIGLIIILLREELSLLLFHDAAYQSVLIWFAVGLALAIFNSLMLAIMNGKSEIRLYVAANISGSLISLVITMALAVTNGIYGALVALSIYQSLAFITTSLICWKTEWFRFRYLFGRTDIRIAKNLGKYALMAITTAVCSPVANMLVRDHLTFSMDIQSAGYWEAMSRLSNAYMMVFTSILSVYFLPKYAQLKSGRALRLEVVNGYRIIMPVVGIILILIYIVRDYIITVLFTAEFMPMRDLFIWYLFGDMLKTGSWLLSFIMLGKAMLRSYVITELLFTVSYVLLTYMFCDWLGFVGSAISYAINYLLYWPTIYFIMSRSVLRCNQSGDER